MFLSYSFRGALISFSLEGILASLGLFSEAVLIFSLTTGLICDGSMNEKPGGRLIPDLYCICLNLKSSKQQQP